MRSCTAFFVRRFPFMRMVYPASSMESSVWASYLYRSYAVRIMGTPPGEVTV